MAKVIATCDTCSLFDDGRYCYYSLRLGEEFNTAHCPSALEPLNPPLTGMPHDDWKWAHAMWERCRGILRLNDAHEQTSEVCTVCGRNKDYGQRCWWCGN